MGCGKLMSCAFLLFTSGNNRYLQRYATPMYHKKSDKILLLGQTTEYKSGAMSPTGRNRHTFYSVFDKVKNEFDNLLQNISTYAKKTVFQ